MNVFPLPAFRQILEDLSTFPIIYADQNAPRDTKPYATIKLRSNSGTDQAELFEPDANDNQDIVENNEAKFDLNFFGPGAISEATRLRSKLRGQNVLDKLFAADVAVLNRGDVNNLTALLSNTQYEQRAMFELTVGWRSTETENVGRIETVEMTGVLTHGDAPNSGVITTSGIQLVIAFE